MNDTKEHARNSRILVVDDSPADLQLLVKVLREKGYLVHAAPSGQLALQFVESYVPDLILLDLHMPDMDGYEVCERLKANESTREVAIIFVSGADQVLDKVKAFS